MAEVRTAVFDWEPPSSVPYVTLDSVLPGGLFSSSIPIDSVSHYEVDRYDPIEKIWLSVGNPRTPRIEFDAQDFEFATIRVRVVMRDGVKSAFVYSGQFLMFGTTAEFDNPNNVPLLSIL